jgi:hypothetical protein
MKTVKAETPATRKRRRGARQSQAKSASIPPESRRSTAAALLKHAPGWAGDDLDEVIDTVRGTRAKTRF